MACAIYATWHLTERKASFVWCQVTGEVKIKLIFDALLSVLLIPLGSQYICVSSRCSEMCVGTLILANGVVIPVEDGVHSTECEQVFSVAVVKAFFHVWALRDEQNRHADNKTKKNKALYGLRESAHNILLVLTSFIIAQAWKQPFVSMSWAGWWSNFLRRAVVAKFKGCSFTHNAVPVQLKAPTGQSELDSSQTATTFKVCGQQHSCLCQKHKLVFIKCSSSKLLCCADFASFLILCCHFSCSYSL